eukprot:766432-Hanusia_phi.AAC.3
MMMMEVMMMEMMTIMMIMIVTTTKTMMMMMRFNFAHLLPSVPHFPPSGHHAHDGTGERALLGDQLSLLARHLHPFLLPHAPHRIPRPAPLGLQDRPLHQAGTQRPLRLLLPLPQPHPLLRLPVDDAPPLSPHLLHLRDSLRPRLLAHRVALLGLRELLQLPDCLRLAADLHHPLPPLELLPGPDGVLRVRVRGDEERRDRADVAEDGG